MRRSLLVLVVPVVLLSGCGDDADSDADTSTTPATGSMLEGSVTVFGAASLTDAFTALGEAFEADHPNVDITFNFGSSSALREQILGGAPADVFASANQSNVDQVIDGGEATESTIFATNLLQIAVPDGNPAKVLGLVDFAEADLLIGLCAEEVPCGQFGRQALAKAGIVPSIDTNGPDARALLTQVETGDLDAGLVYRTDVLATDGLVDGVEIPADQNVRADYPIAQLTDSETPGVATAFIEFVTSADGQAILADFGFGPG